MIDTLNATLSEAVRMLFSPATLFAIGALLFLTGSLGFEVGTFIGFAEYRDTVPQPVQMADISQYSFRGGYGD